MKAITIDKNEWAAFLKKQTQGEERCSLLRDKPSKYIGDVCLVCDEQTVAIATITGWRKVHRRFLVDFATQSFRRVVEMPVPSGAVASQPDERGELSELSDDEITEYPQVIFVDAKGLEMRGYEINK